jgi:uncharacterized protein (DUF433 family)
MRLRLTPDDRKYLEAVAGRRVRPTKRQKAQALLGLALGGTPESVSMRVGIKKDDIATLVEQFMKQGLKGVGLEQSGRKRSGKSQHHRVATIEKSPGVCGGAARVTGTRVPVWQLVEARVLGASEAQLLIDCPRLKAVNLADAWAYAKDHADEIAIEIRQNEVACPRPCPLNPSLSHARISSIASKTDDELTAEINAVRYGSPHVNNRTPSRPGCSIPVES